MQLRLDEASFWRLTPKLLRRLADEWWQMQQLHDLRGWAVARSTARLIAGESVSAAEDFPALRHHDAQPVMPDEMDDFFAAVATANG